MGPPLRQSLRPDDTTASGSRGGTLSWKGRRAASSGMGDCGVSGLASRASMTKSTTADAAQARPPAAATPLAHPIATRGRATLIGFSAILMWSLLALFTAASGAVPPFQLAAMTFALGALV